MPTFTQEELRQCQLDIEANYSRKNLSGYMQEELLESESITNKMLDGVILANEWAIAHSDELGDSLTHINLTDLVMDIVIESVFCVRPVPFVTMTAGVALSQGFDDKLAGIKATAELVAELASLDLYDIGKYNGSPSWQVVSRITMSDKFKFYLDNGCFLPPMVCPPKEVTHNFESGYLTQDSSVVLGSGNHHNEPLALDVINIQNRVPLVLNTDQINDLEETPTFDLDTLQKLQNWEAFQEQSTHFYNMMNTFDCFYLDNKYDCRGRFYDKGYHIHTQGNAYKKSILDFANKETVEVPEEFRCAT